MIIVSRETDLGAVYSLIRWVECVSEGHEPVFRSITPFFRVLACRPCVQVQVQVQKCVRPKLKGLNTNHFVQSWMGFGSAFFHLTGNPESQNETFTRAAAHILP
jgi:hypothetical protein